MPELMLDLSLDNFDEIEQLLLRSYEKSVMFLNSFDLVVLNIKDMKWLNIKKK